MIRRRSALLAILPLLLSGCGGSGGGGKTSGGIGRIYPRVTIAWPAQTRTFAAPSIATAARIVFVDPRPGHYDLTQTVTRPEGSAAIDQTATFEYAVKPGNHLLRVEFLSDWSSNAPVAVASLEVKLLADGTLRTLNGKPLGTIAYAAQVAGLSLTVNGDVEVGETVGVTVTAFTESGVAALTPGVVRLTATSGAEKIAINPDGFITGVAEGSVTLMPSIDGLTGSSATIAVQSAPTAAQSINLETSDFAFDPTRNLLWVATPGGSVQSVDPATGAVGTTFELGSYPTTLALSDDASTLYVGLRAAGAVRKIDLTTNSLGPQFAVPGTESGRGGYVRRIAVQPGHPSTVGLTCGLFAYPGQGGIQVFDEGIKRPNGLGTLGGSEFLWTAANRIVSWNMGSNGDTLWDVAIDAQGASIAQSVQPGLGNFFSDLILSGNRLYGRNGIVLDSTTFQRIGAFDLGNTIDGIDRGPAIDAARKRIYFVKLVNHKLRLYSYDLETFALIGTRRITGSIYLGANGSRVDMVKTPAGLALRFPTQIVLIKDLAGL